MPLDALALLFTGLAVLTMASVQLLLWRSFRRPIALRWASTLGLLALIDLLQVVAALSVVPAVGRVAGIAGNLAALVFFVSFALALGESAGARLLWWRRAIGGALVFSAAFAALLVLSEPAALAATPGIWYRSAGNPVVRGFYSAMILLIASYSWVLVRRRAAMPGMLLLAIGMSVGILRPSMIVMLESAGFSGGVTRVVTLTVITLVADMLLVGVGSLLIVLQDENARALAAATRVERAERMARLGLMAGSIAHDMNNVLASLTLSIDFARDPRATPAQLREELDAIEAAVEHGRAMSQRLLSFANGSARRESPPVPLARWLATQQAQLQHAVGAPHQVAVAIDPVLADGVDTVRVDPTRLLQLLVNTAINSRDAARSGEPSRIAITLRIEVLEAELAVGLFQLGVGRWMVLLISDNGPGFPPASLDRVFEPFFTTKGALGTGLGLATVFAVARDAGGAVTAYNHSTGGAVIECWLPCDTAA